jgi:hypothetical protein
MDSQNVVPKGIQAAKVDYNQPQTLIDALKGQDVLVITMNTRAPGDSQIKLVEAAAAAGVPYVIPSDWCPPMTNEQFADDMLLGPNERAVRKRVEELGKSSWIAFITSFWYEYSVAWGPTTYGFDLKNRTVTFFDDGMQKINTSVSPPPPIIKLIVSSANERRYRLGRSAHEQSPASSPCPSHPPPGPASPTTRTNSSTPRRSPSTRRTCSSPCCARRTPRRRTGRSSTRT